MKKILCLLVLLLLAGCGAAEPPGETAAATTAPLPVQTQPQILEEAVAMAEAPAPPAALVLRPEAPGTREERSADAVIDYSHTRQGYVMVCYTAPAEKRLKVRVTGPTTTYTYNLPQGEWTAFPLSDGNGEYRVTVYINTVDSKYATVLSAVFPVELEDEFAPFLRPNQYVDYTAAENTVALGAALCDGLIHPLEKVAAVYDYVVAELSYDYDKAATVKSGYLPVLDTVLEEKKGICFDYAALMSAMLRSQQVPCKLVVGYAGTVYHAWISVWTEESGWIDGVVFFDGHSWKRMDPTFDSSSGHSPEILDFIENGNYTVKYLY
ncbi:MAG: transglutaminase domain-containing protein [Oscillospiraceae bacterium]|nr:transglutaminase domain-containing protein [Oscillospiraceae bacterium]